jgi:hypothetical protein
MDILKEQFSAGEVAEAIGIDQTRLQNWMRRSSYALPVPIAGRRLFSAEFTIRMAFVKELARFGMGPYQASDIVHGWGLCAPDDHRASWLSAPTGKETQILFVSLRPETERDEDKSGNHGSKFFEEGFFSCIRGHGSVFFNESATELEAEDRSYLVMPIGSVVKTVLQKLQAVLNIRMGVTDAI